MNKVVAANGDMIDFDAAVNLMDDDLREVVHAQFAPCSDQEFYNQYCELHYESYGEEFYVI